VRLEFQQPGKWTPIKPKDRAVRPVSGIVRLVVAENVLLRRLNCLSLVG
jgi:hypothetical protein